MAEKSYLTPIESEALVDPGLIHRAKAIRSLARIAVLTDTSEADVESEVNRIRAMGTRKAKRTAKQFARTVRVLDRLVSSDNEEVVSVGPEPVAGGVQPEAYVTDELIEADDIRGAIGESVEVEQSEDALPDRARQLVNGIFGHAAIDALELRLSDSATIIDTLMVLRDGKFDRDLMRARFDGLFAGLGNKEIGERTNTAPGATGMGISNHRKYILDDPSYDQVKAFGLLEGAIKASRGTSPGTTTEPKVQPASDEYRETERVAEEHGAVGHVRQQSLLQKAVESHEIPSKVSSTPPSGESPSPLERVRLRKDADISIERTLLHDAVYEQEMVSREQWLEASRKALTTLIPESRDEHYGTALWQLFQFDYDETVSGPRTDGEQDALDFLRPLFYKYFDSHVKAGSLNDIGLRALLIKQPGSKGLETAYENMRRKNPNVTKRIVERILMLTVTELVHERSSI